MDEDLEKSDGTFDFTPSQERINSNGTFTFAFNFLLVSTSFKVSASSATVTLSATVPDPPDWTGTPNINGGYPFTVTFSKVNLVGATPLGTGNFNANGGTGSFTVSGLNTNDTYRLAFGAQNLSAGWEVTGSGSISNYVQP